MSFKYNVHCTMYTRKISQIALNYFAEFHFIIIMQV